MCAVPPHTAFSSSVQFSSSSVQFSSVNKQTRQDLCQKFPASTKFPMAVKIEVFCALPPIRHLVVRVRVRVQNGCQDRGPYLCPGPGFIGAPLRCAQCPDWVRSWQSPLTLQTDTSSRCRPIMIHCTLLVGCMILGYSGTACWAPPFAIHAHIYQHNAVGQIGG